MASDRTSSEQTRSTEDELESACKMVIETLKAITVLDYLVDRYVVRNRELKKANEELRKENEELKQNAAELRKYVARLESIRDSR